MVILYRYSKKYKLTSLVIYGILCAGCGEVLTQVEVERENFW